MKGSKIPYNQNHKEINGIIYKKCNKHNVYFSEDDPWLPCTEEYFYKNPKNKTDGLYPYCIKCAIKSASERQQKHRDNLLLYKKKYYNKNKEKMKSQSATNRKSKPNYYKEKTKEYRESQKGKEKYKIYNLKRQKKKHIMTKNEWMHTKNYFKNENGEWSCAYCGLSINDHLIERKGKLTIYDFHKEHVIDNGRNDIKNCVPSCQSCNSEKGTKTLNEWYNPNNPKYTYERYYKIYLWMRYDCKKYTEKKTKKQENLNKI